MRNKFATSLVICLAGAVTSNVALASATATLGLATSTLRVYTPTAGLYTFPGSVPADTIETFSYDSTGIGLRVSVLTAGGSLTKRRAIYTPTYEVTYDSGIAAPTTMTVGTVVSVSPAKQIMLPVNIAMGWSASCDDDLGGTGQPWMDGFAYATGPFGGPVSVSYPGFANYSFAHLHAGKFPIAITSWKKLPSGNYGGTVNFPLKRPINVYSESLSTGLGAQISSAVLELGLRLSGSSILTPWSGAVIETTGDSANSRFLTMVAEDLSGTYEYVVTEDGGEIVGGGDLANGTYAVTLEAAGMLRRIFEITVNNGAVSTVGSVNLRFGDADGSGEIDAGDLDIAIANFGLTEDDEEWYVGADGFFGAWVDADGSGEVDSADLDMITANFGQTGD